jgi:hypothetical protein
MRPVLRIGAPPQQDGTGQTEKATGEEQRPHAQAIRKPLGGRQTNQTEQGDNNHLEDDETVERIGTAAAIAA